MGVKKSSSSATSGTKGKVGKKTNTSSGSHSNGKPFQLLNSIITKDDITPLSKSLSGNRVDGTVATAKDVNNAVGFAACDNQTESLQDGTSRETAAASSSSVVINSVASTPDPDLLFSPLNSGVDDEGDDDDEDVYDHELLSPIYFTAQYPKRFHRRSSSLNPSITEQRKHSISGYPLSDLLGNTTSEDFWKEVSTTNEEAIYYPEGAVMGETSSPKLSATAVESSSQDLSDTSFDEYITEDLSAAPSSAVDSSTWNEDYKIKLLCYRDATGKLRLKTKESNSYTVSKQVSNSVRKTVSRQPQKKGKKNKNKLLKHAIRRKSGVWEMVSTGIGIGEFML